MIKMGLSLCYVISDWLNNEHFYVGLHIDQHFLIANNVVTLLHHIFIQCQAIRYQYQYAIVK